MVGKRMLALEELEAQTVLELPTRETPATVIIGCLAVCVGQIRIQNVDVDVANQICIAVNALVLAGGVDLECTVRR